jgi:ABC-type branched-subunit amino acid transport system ATPase component
MSWSAITRTPNTGPLRPLFNGAAVRRQDKAVKEEMQELLEFIGLADHAEIPAAELSGGQRRLLALGRAIAMRPKMLLLDEPGAGLSPVNVDSLMSTIMTLKERYNLTNRCRRAYPESGDDDL